MLAICIIIILALNLELISKCVIDYEPKEFEQLLKDEITNLDENELSLIGKLFQKFKKLEEQKKNKIWTGVIKNSFAPLYQGKFEYIVGNPPWISWESLPEDYRKSTVRLWAEYGLASKTEGIGLGKIKKDLSMLFVVRSAETYLSDSGKLAFLVTWTAFKNQAGAGFRNYLSNRCQVRSVHEMVEMRPFEDAVNRTALVVLQKGKTKFPITSVSWQKTKGGTIPQDASPDEIALTAKKIPMLIQPVGNNPLSPWLMVTSQVLQSAKNIFGSSLYKARAGVVTMLNGVYWLKIISRVRESDAVLVENLGDISWKKKVKIEKAIIEDELVYSLLRGIDVKRWNINPKHYILMPSDSEGHDIDESTMKVKYPKTYEFLGRFFAEFVARSGEPYKTKLEPYKRMGRKLRNAEHPFYYIFNAKHQFGTFKVVWKHVSGAITGKGEFNVAVVSSLNDKIIGTKPIILDHGLMFVNCSSEDEAHYMAAILNSSIFRSIVKGYSLETHITTDIFDYLRLPEFDNGDKMHIELAQKSKEAHELAAEGNLGKVKKVEDDIDELVDKLFSD